ncbi:MAG: pentapeptide repeat-containing protein [Fischerella sp.]|uniref:pentapeptide repeat-containing protein n=1 Tax=Fischerella sp. TaxID=1191 RepID=UPI0017DEBD8A|nr:pentapeptide repeat-containing protein [Fischerella sp.]NWF60182.1 pentapeptide repeat-containing protein [Fischerella sp.]
MARLSEVWKRLITYVRRSQAEQMSDQTHLESELGLTLLKINKTQTNFRELLLSEQLQESLEEWTKTVAGGSFRISDRQLDEKIYDLFGNGALQGEIVEVLIQKLIASRDFCPVALFQRLDQFYQRWCQGEFIDAAPHDNLPQKKMLQLQAQNMAIGLRQVDINTGLNVLILLLELHCYAQHRDDLKAKIIFYPSGQRDTDNFFTSGLLRVINYSDAIEIGNFSNIVGEFLQGSNLSGAYLGDANLTGVNFSNANLSGAYFGDANLTGANFSGANLSAANLGDANLSGANLSAASLRCTDLSSANLSGANFSGADLNRAELSSADLSSANLNGADLSHANLTSANFRDAKLSSSHLNHAILFGANLSDAILNGANLSHADLCRADLSGTDLNHATLKGTNLSDTILFGANLRDAILIAADLSYAKLNGAKLHGANLKSAILLGADLSGVDLSEVILNEADLSGVILNEADLSGADLSDANLEKMTWNENLEWGGVRGLDKAVNMPEALKQQLGLR